LAIQSMVVGTMARVSAMRRSEPVPASEFAHAPQALNTQRAYRADWADFAAWCSAHTVSPLPASPTTVSSYVGASARYHKLSTLRRRLAAISHAHQSFGYRSPTTDPTVRAALSSACLTNGSAQQAKAPVMAMDLRAMIVSLPDSLLGERDRALLLLGFAGAFRRSDLVSLEIADVEQLPEGLLVRRRTSGEPQGSIETIVIPRSSRALTCPVRALADWIAISGIIDGPLFRPIDRHGTILPHRLSDRSVARIVQRAAVAAGLDPATFAGHSLRSGLAASAAAAGVPEQAIMAITGLRSLPSVRRYCQDIRHAPIE
jgi:site-specific recombinase XerD